MSNSPPAHRPAPIVKFRFLFRDGDEDAEHNALIPVKSVEACTVTVADLCAMFTTRASKKYAHVGGRAIESICCADLDNGGTFTLDLAMNGGDTLDCYFAVDSTLIQDITVTWRSAAAVGESPPRKYVPSKPPAPPPKLQDDCDSANGGRSARPPRHRVGSAPTTSTTTSTTTTASNMGTTSTIANSERPPIPLDDTTVVVMSFPSPQRRSAPQSPASSVDDGDWVLRQVALLMATEEEDREAILLESVMESRYIEKLMDAERQKIVDDRVPFQNPRTPSASPQGTATGASHRRNIAHTTSAMSSVESDWLSVRFSILTEERKAWRQLTRECAATAPPPRSPPSPQQPQRHTMTSQRPTVTATDETAFAIRALVVAEEAARDSTIRSDEDREFRRITEDAWLSLKRLQLKQEGHQIAQIKALVADEQAQRENLYNQQTRKFSLFTSLCEKGLQRIATK